MTARDVEACAELKPCPFCGGPAKLEKAQQQRHKSYGLRQFWGVVCRNTINVGGSCCMEQVPSASVEAAVARWNMRNGESHPPTAPWPSTETVAPTGTPP